MTKKILRTKQSLYLKNIPSLTYYEIKYVIFKNIKYDICNVCFSFTNFGMFVIANEETYIENMTIKWDKIMLRFNKKDKMVLLKLKEYDQWNNLSLNVGMKIEGDFDFCIKFNHRGWGIFINNLNKMIF
jgi:hypothetical protein